MDPRTLFVVEDHPVFRMGLERLIEAQADLRLVGTAESGDEALALLVEHAVDLVLVDLSLPGMDGIELVRALRSRWPGQAALVLSAHPEGRYGARAARAGARGYLNKDAEAPEILSAIRSALLPEPEGSAGRASSGAGLGEIPAHPVEALTARQREVFELIAQGLGTRQVAARLGIGVKTVETHKAHIKSKLGLRTATELVREAVAWSVGLL